MKRSTHDGAEVISLSITRPGDNDLIDHTLRHFVCEPFDRLPPRDAMTASEARAALVEIGVLEQELNRLSRSGGALLWRWWRGPRRACLERIHDEGYWPRYLAIICAHPLPGARRSPWRKGTRQRWELLDEGRAVVWAKWKHNKRTLRVTSAYRHLLSDGGLPVSDSQSVREQFAWALK